MEKYQEPSLSKRKRDAGASSEDAKNVAHNKRPLGALLVVPETTTAIVPPTGSPAAKEAPCSHTCPQKDLAKNGLTDEAIRGQCLFCRYPTPPCESCGFCKYSTVSLLSGYAAMITF